MALVELGELGVSEFQEAIFYPSEIRTVDTIYSIASHLQGVTIPITEEAVLTGQVIEEEIRNYYLDRLREYDESHKTRVPITFPEMDRVFTEAIATRNDFLETQSLKRLTMVSVGFKRLIDQLILTDPNIRESIGSRELYFLMGDMNDAEKCVARGFQVGIYAACLYPKIENDYIFHLGLTDQGEPVNLTHNKGPSIINPVSGDFYSRRMKVSGDSIGWNMVLAR